MSDTPPATAPPARLVMVDPDSGDVIGPIEAVTPEAEAVWRAKGYVDAPDVPEPVEAAPYPAADPPPPPPDNAASTVNKD